MKDEKTPGYWKEMYSLARQELIHLQEAIVKHHSQKADDRCIFDDDELYAAAGLRPPDRRVGDKCEMLKNCARFIEKRCEPGGWPTYKELEQERDELAARVLELEDGITRVLEKI